MHACVQLLSTRARRATWFLAVAAIVLTSAAAGGARATAGTTTPGLVAAYTFDAGRGTVLADASGSGNEGKISGAVWSTRGHSGRALSFDGVNDWVTVADRPSLDLATGMTLEAWVKPSTVRRIWRTVVTKEQVGNLVYGLFGSSNTRRPATIISIGSDRDQDIVRGRAAVAASAWTHLAATYNDSRLRLYVNGASVGSRAVRGAMRNSSRPLRIGGNNVRRAWFRGRIDDLRIYNRSLSAAEIRTDMNTPVGSPSPAPPPPRPSGASVFLTPSGSDSSACTQAAPCRSFDRAYRVAQPGQTVELAGGTYGSQTINPDATKTSAADVLFRPAAGASVSVASAQVYGSHLEIRGVSFTTRSSWRTRRSADDVTFRNDSGPKFTILGSSNVRVIGGSYGPFDNGSNDIAPESPSDSKVPTNILIDGVSIHDFRQTNGSAHVDCIHTWGLNGLTIRNSRMWNCQHFNILFTVDSVAGTPTKVTIENNFLACCRTGFYSIFLGDQHGERYSNYLIRNNSTNKPIGIGRSNIQTISNLRFYANIAPRFEGCGRTGVIADYNVWYAGAKCGGNDRVAPSGFASPSAFDFHLVAGAAAIDRGNPSSYPSADIDGQARPLGAAPDAGADERQ